MNKVATDQFAWTLRLISAFVTGILAVPRENVFAHPRSDQGLRCPLTEPLDAIKCINGELMPGCCIAHDELCILRMLKDYFRLAHPL